MSWDIYVQDLRPGIVTIADMPDDFRPNWRMARAALIQSIQAVVPAGRLREPDLGVDRGA